MSLLTDSKTHIESEEKSEGFDSNLLWRKFILRLKNEFDDQIYQRWLSKIEPFLLRKQEAIICTSSKFLRDWIKREYLESGGKSGKGIKQILLEENPSFKNISIIYSPPKENKKDIEDAEDTEDLIQTQKIQATKVASISKYDNVFNLGIELNTRFTFENFVVGKCNQLAYKAAKIVAGAEKNPSFSAEQINPLFLYGGVGLGKTHLAQSVAWYIKNHDKNSRVIYLSAERFMYQFVQSLRNKDIMEFKEKFRCIDVLIIDDLQFVSGKEGTQKELLQTLNSLIEENKQIILVCDKSPGDLTNMDQRLKSKIGAGMIIDFKCPDYKTRVEILKSKIKDTDVQISDQIFDLLATKINSSVRDLEGALKKMVANYMLTGEKIDLQSTKALLQDLFRTNHSDTTVEQIQKLTANYYNIKVADLKSKVRSRDVARPRQIAVYLTKKLTSKSLPDIGKEFGGKNHATIIHAVKKIGQLILADNNIAQDVKNIEDKLIN